MTYRSTYQAAGIVAAPIEEHFNRLAAGGDPACEDSNRAPVPSSAVIEALIDAAFWASLRREEGHSPRISLAFLPPEQAGNPLLFGHRIPLSPAILTKLAPGVERAGVHLGVWTDGDELYLWGTTLSVPNFCFVLDVSEPGLLVIKHRRICGYGKYTNVAVLKGDQVKIVDAYNGGVPDCPDMLKYLLGFYSAASWNDPLNVLIQLAVSMRAHRHGGTLLLVSAEDAGWQHSIIQPVQYPVMPTFSGLSELIFTDVESRGSESARQSSLNREIEHLAGLTAVDGATIINTQYELLAFGAKIGRASGRQPVEQVAMSEPVIGGESVIVHSTQIGGTRHLSAAQFVHDQPDAHALVASQDGHFTIFTWSQHRSMVQAHRIDSLLL
ncbi:hypothetical protein FW774_09700 [Pedobacter sp. BS3]|uniref:putative sensor domain DACNV-containing protein n=1 Tax=Pedobacter sp. BS3 TaxID=2567937 RepID=UPI0011ED087A|nr:hypothetical protein [Pedobacter sp. BS3]TZF83736.1 hypothetical protein FW774_09700 [Pedobacter sp. BS3]